METWTTIADKITWGDGPWVHEPDKAQWVDETTGLTCLAKRNKSMGFWCGYVGVHGDHPLHGCSYDSPEAEHLNAHGDLTYSEACQEDEQSIEYRICHIPEPGEPDDMWWFGFDCGHYMDFMPAMAIHYAGLNIPMKVSNEKYRTLKYVQKECARLAQQLAATTD